MYDFKITNMEIGELFYWANIKKFIRYKSEFFGLTKKNLKKEKMIQIQ